MKTAVRDDIQGLRALAVLAVLIFHVNAAWLPGGYIGVDVFFVISGFLITGILMRDRQEKRFRFGAFYANRIARIVPAYVAMLLITALGSAVLLLPQDFAYFWSSLKSALLFTSNSHFAGSGDYFSPAAHEWPLLHTWSLAVEMQFYLFLPLLVLALPSRQLIKVLLLLAVGLTLAAQSRLMTPGQEATTYYALWARAPEFLMGALAAGLKPPGERWQGRLPPWIATAALVLLLICLALMDEEVLFPGLSALLPCAATAILLWCPNGWVQRGLSARVMVWIGERSYSLYLWHWPLLALLRYYVGEHTLDAGVLALYGLGVLLLADASHRWIETPFRRRPYRKGTWWMATSLTMVALLLMAGTRSLNKGIVEPLPMELSRYAPPEQICHGKIVGNCLRGVASSDTHVLLMGDSHAAQLNLFADEVGRKEDVAITVISASSCVPIPGFDTPRIPDYARSECANQIREANLAAANSSTILLAGKWTYHTPSDLFMSAMDRFLTEQTAQGRRVIVLAQVPPLLSDPVRAQRWASMGLPVQAVRIDPHGAMANQRMQALVARHEKAEFRVLTSGDALESAWPADASALYADRHHLNEAGARFLGRHATMGLGRQLSP